MLPFSLDRPGNGSGSARSQGRTSRALWLNPWTGPGLSDPFHVFQRLTVKHVPKRPSGYLTCTSGPAGQILLVRPQSDILSHGFHRHATPHPHLVPVPWAPLAECLGPGGREGGTGLRLLRCSQPRSAGDQEGGGVLGECESTQTGPGGKATPVRWREAARAAAGQGPPLSLVLAPVPLTHT